MATIFFARLLKSPEDLPENIQLCDLYTFGSPRVGDKDFSRHFESEIELPLRRPSAHWRVVAGRDRAAMIPPSLADTTIGEYMSSSDSWNFAHVGNEIRLSKNPDVRSEPYTIFKGGEVQPNFWKRILPGWNDHFPKSYWDAMKNSEKFL